MSFHCLKETLLRPCSTSTTSTSTSSSQPTSPLRKPPKSSLSRQLLRLDPTQLLLPRDKHKPTSDAAAAREPPFEPPVPSQFPSRKPPKSCLSQQLQRLQLPDFSPSLSIPNRNGDKFEREGKDDEGEEEEEGCEEDVRVNWRRPVKNSGIPAPGPYEPLVLSEPGEVPVVQVPASINCRLLEHQRYGVRFLYNLYKQNHGGVLGDDMGLGKTIQTIAFLSAIIGRDPEIEDITRPDESGYQIGPILILCPTSVIKNWENEFAEWGEFHLAIYHGPNRELVLQKIESGSIEILITSFDTFRIHDQILCEIPWVIVIVDEAHRLKNEKSKLYISCQGIKTKNRYGLTGTILQNKIMELFNLFDWVVPGCLGDRDHFRGFYDEPLKLGQRLSAPDRFVQIAEERKGHLVSVLKSYLLRRTKEETIGHLMLGKEDNVVFCKMSDLQKRVYRRMLTQTDVQCIINKDIPCFCGGPLPQVECCKRTEPQGVIWSYLHKDNPDGCAMCPFCLVLPCLMKLQQISNHLELIKPNPRDEPEKQKKDAELASAVFGSDVDLVGGSSKSESFMGLSDAEHCGKMRALEKLLALWVSQGDKTLLFSYSVRMLDILEKFLIRKGYCFSRFDGSTPMNTRQDLVDEFNKSPSKQVFLISTRAGGLGVNLVSANRVVIFDPSWNPAQDLQAQDRSFRYGQKRHVTVFRLLAAGSLEELVYSRQIYKQQLSNIAVSGKMEKRYFEGVQDNKNFQGELFGISNLFRDLSDKLFTSEIIEMHEKHGKSTSDKGGQIGSMIDEPGTTAAVLAGSNMDNEACASDQASLKNLGIVYAHRNEDVVNMGITKTHVFTSADTSKKVDASCNAVTKSNKSRQPAGREDRKRKEFSCVASFMGMRELEFSKWVLSASPLERHECLENYKKKRKYQL
ncbi:DNA repair/recombination protein [Rhynchospora pubera]|uniref:DNA repair/recombination protein n=1 Tax=Rhynchospora pubera TaxID=906938 RepID=A0AAV8EN98_9POAL|nr:DNA repair/recombination protein [Rhynchospora pubera]